MSRQNHFPNPVAHLRNSGPHSTLGRAKFHRLDDTAGTVQRLEDYHGRAVYVDSGAGYSLSVWLYALVYLDFVACIPANLSARPS